MSPRGRAMLGAAVGALLVLLARHETRPGLLAALAPVPENAISKVLAHRGLDRPDNPDAAAAYLHAGAERLQGGSSLGADERRTLLEIARRGEERERENPFWTLALAVFQGSPRSAVAEAWRRASRGTRYFDHQRPGLLADVKRCGRGGDVQAWAYVAVAPRRSAAMIRQIRACALRQMRLARSEGQRTELAYETIRIGAMIRDGSERLSLGREGIEMIEEATYPPGLLPAGSGSATRRLWIAKTTLTRHLRDAGRAADATYCDRQFQKNDATVALTDVADPEDRFNAFAIGAVFADALPGAFLVVSIFGLLVWLFSRRLAGIAHGSNRFHGSGLALGALLLLSVGAWAGYPWIGLAAGFCALVPAASPERPRRFDGDPLGPLHALVVMTVGVVLVGSIVLASVARSLPGRLLPELGGYGAVLGGFGRWVALGVAVLGASAFVAPAWAVVRRFPTPALAAHTYRILGRNMAIIGLAAAIFASPVAFAVDRWLGNDLAEIALNEQNAYGPTDPGER